MKKKNSLVQLILKVKTKGNVILETIYYYFIIILLFLHLIFWLCYIRMNVSKHIQYLKINKFTNENVSPLSNRIGVFSSPLFIRYCRRILLESSNPNDCTTRTMHLLGKNWKFHYNILLIWLPLVQTIN